MDDITKIITDLLDESADFDNLISVGYKGIFVPSGSQLFRVTSLKRVSNTLVAFYGVANNLSFEVVQNVQNLNVLFMECVDIPEPVHRAAGYITI